MIKPPSRRRFIAISAAIAGMTALPTGITLAATPVHRWRGVAMGADAEMLLYHNDSNAAARLIEACLSEVHRLERIFSLYRDDSAISRLNTDGVLHNPPPELVDLLSRSNTVSELTDGAFDITVQSLWRLYQDHFTSGAGPNGPPQAALNAAKENIDYRAVSVRPEMISFDNKGMAITLNGIAQGYITDAVTNVLRRSGAKNVLVNMGEIRAVGQHADGGPWRVGLSSEIDAEIELVDQAIATSAGDGMVFPSSDSHHHLFDPHSGQSANLWKSMTVIAQTATMADALSTAFSSMSHERIRAICSQINVSAQAISQQGHRQMKL